MSLLFRQIDYNIDLLRRTIILEEEVSAYTPYYINQRVDAIVHATNDSESPITLNITSYGGDVYGMLGTVDTIKALPMEINTIGRGAVLSAATWILAAGTGSRSVTRNTVVMIHEINKLMAGTSKDIITEASHMRALQDRVYKIFEENTARAAAYWKKHTKVNLYLTAEQCVEHGIVDAIILDHVKSTEGDKENAVS